MRPVDRHPNARERARRDEKVRELAATPSSSAVDAETFAIVARYVLGLGSWTDRRVTSFPEYCSGAAGLAAGRAPRGLGAIRSVINASEAFAVSTVIRAPLHVPWVR